VLATVFFSVGYIRWPTSLFCIFFHLKAERTEGRKQHLSKTKGRKLYLQISKSCIVPHPSL